MQSEENTTTYTFHVSGMHCKACEHLIEGELGDIDDVTAVDADLTKQVVTVTGEFGVLSPEEVAAVLTRPIEPHGYTLATERVAPKRSWSDFKLAVPAALAFIVFFILLQKAGVVSLFDTSGVSYGTAFLIGVIASVSTCMAVVGGLLLSMSATFAKEGSTRTPQVLFHMGRLIAFFVLGGVIGAVGTAFTLSTVATFVLGILIGFVMLMLGINLLDVFHGAKRFNLAMPKILSRHALEVTKFNHTFTPFLVGVATFFLPCGFTQSMQLYTLGSGSFMNGALTMFTFALGTLPVLALLSVTSVSISKSRYAGAFFKTAGLIVIAFALMNIINSFVIMGYIAPVFNF